MVPYAFSNKRWRSGRGVGVEQPVMLVEGEAVGHAGEVVGRNSRGSRLVGAGGEAAPLAGHAFGLGEIERKQVMDDPPGLRAHPVDPIMAVHPFEQKLL